MCVICVVAVSCSVLQCVAVCCDILHCIVVGCSDQQYAAMYCKVLQRGEVPDVRFEVEAR